MSTIQAYYNGSVFVPLTPVKAQLNQQALIIIVEINSENAERKNLGALFGALSSESYLEMREALRDTERVDINEW